eukprot:scaffold65949_cov38-Prasinocladus_malaysianus.AAC.1
MVAMDFKGSLRVSSWRRPDSPRGRLPAACGQQTKSSRTSGALQHHNCMPFCRHAQDPRLSSLCFTWGAQGVGDGAGCGSPDSAALKASQIAREPRVWPQNLAELSVTRQCRKVMTSNGFGRSVCGQSVNQMLDKIVAEAKPSSPTPCHFAGIAAAIEIFSSVIGFLTLRWEYDFPALTALQGSDRGPTSNLAPPAQSAEANRMAFGSRAIKGSQ